jgi:uncharacterized protein (DUF1778 family)
MSTVQAPIIISIRAKAGQRDLIDQAAERLGRSRSDFMLDAACRQAEDVLLDQTYFALDAKRLKAFAAMLDNPPPPTDRLRRTLNAPLPWASPAVPANTKPARKARSASARHK